MGGGGTGGGNIGPEQCNDGFDNDQNGKTDCDDSACTSACGSACSKPDLLSDPATISGATSGHADSAKNSCSKSTGGADVAYELTAKNSGMLEVNVGGFSDLSLSVRSACSGAELGCTTGKSLKLPVAQGTKLWIVVDANSASTGGPFGLSAQSYAIACGDKHIDGSETCDDGNTKAGDGCSANCTLEVKEVEPNDTSAQANAWASPFVGIVSSASDQDAVKVVLSKTGVISASVRDMGDNACDLGKLDSYIELVDKDGATLLAANDNWGDGKCSSVSKAGLPAGTYYVVVSAASGAPFPYRLEVTLN